MELRKMILLPVLLLISGLSPRLTAQITPREAAADMQKGINLGNTLEPPREGDWGNPLTQEYYFDLYKDAGFQTVRIPVRWDEHTQTSPPYHIDNAWMNRIEQIVDWGLARGLYIVINAHHEEWIKANYDNAGYRARFDSIWSQIALRFKDKPEKLLFEIINEPYGLTKIQNDDLHARILSIIRNTNPTRIVIFQGHNWGGSDELIAAAVPDDDYIMGSFHSYDPYLFGLEGEGTWGTPGDYTILRNKFISVKNWSDATNIPVFLGEFGSLKTCDYNSRMRHYRAYVEYSQIYGFVSCAWDDGGSFRIMEREAHKWNELKDILIHTDTTSPVIKSALIYQDTMIRLNWSDPTGNCDSIFIQRRTEYSDYARYGTLAGDETDFYDDGAGQNVFYYYRIIGHHNGGTDAWSQPVRNKVPVYIPKVRTFYNGIPAAVPGTVEAEDFDIGGEGFTWHDADPMNIPGKYRPDEGVDIYFINWESYQIGYAYTGEWYEYTVNVEEAGEYTISTYIAALLDGGSFSLKVGDVESGPVQIKSTGSWNTTKEFPVTLDLPAGQQIMRFSVLSEPQFHIDKFEFTRTPDGSSPLHTAPSLTVYQDQSNELVIRMKNGPALQHAELFNITGTTVLSEDISGNDSHISISDIRPGIYIVRVSTSAGIFTRKTMIGR